MWRSNKKADLEKMKERKVFVVYDLETTGLDLENDVPIQISAIRYALRDKVYTVDDTMSMYINTDRTISEGAARVNRMTKGKLETLSGGKTEDDLFPLIEEYFVFGTIPVVGYNNTRFDDILMRKMFERHGKQFRPEVSLDVFQMVNDWLPDDAKIKRNLASISSYYGITDAKEEFHEATFDTAATAKLFMKLARNYYKVPVPVKKTLVTKITLWDSNPRIPRLYVQTEDGEVYYDIRRHAWCNKSVNMDVIDMDDIVSQAYAMAGVETEGEFGKYRPSTEVA